MPVTAQSLRGLYAITDSALLADGRLLPYCEAALRGGVKLLQYRDKSNDGAKRLVEAQALQSLCQSYDARLIINDDVSLAAQIGADLHLGQTDGNLVDARQQLGPDAIIGSTCHAQLELAKQAVAQLPAPAIIIVGEVVALHGKLAWFNTQENIKESREEKVAC